MTGRIGLLLLLLFVNAEAASTQQERKVDTANVPLPVARPSSSVPIANVVNGANVPMVQYIPMMQNAQPMQNVPMIQNLPMMQNVPMMANMANIGQRQLIPMGTVNIPNLGNVPVYGVPVSINQAGQLQIGTGLGGLNLAGLNGGGLTLTGLNGGSVNLASAVGASSSGVTRQMSAVSVLSVVAANLWYHWSC